MDWDETVARVRRAAAFCVEAGLERFRIDEEGVTIEVRRSAASPAAAYAATPAPATSAVAAANGATAAAGPEPQVLRAEFVGVVRLSRPALGEGAPVAAGRELAYVEALGIRNPVRAVSPGRVAAVYVDDGQPVEFGQALFALEPSS